MSPSSNQPAVFEMHNFAAEGDSPASHSGSGTVEMLAVVDLLKDAGIPSCIVGTHPLGYYGAGRVPMVWELCVPDDKLAEAVQLFTSERLSHLYEPWSVGPAYPESLLHTFPRFHLKGIHFTFYLVPSSDWLINCDESSCEKSSMGLPYPKLEHLAKSLLDTQRWVDLEDLVDGMNLSEEWGEQHLDLDCTLNVDYARKKNEKIRATVPETPFSDLMEINEDQAPLRPIWQDIVRSKERRIGDELPKDQYLTRFFPLGGADPRLKKRNVF